MPKSCDTNFLIPSLSIVNLAALAVGVTLYPSASNSTRARTTSGDGGRIAVGAAVAATPHAFGANFVKRVGTEARYRGTVVERRRR